jgi:glycosyltransferase involved in cell wall biosynthesis
MDRDEILKKIDAIRQTVAGQNLPNIYLLHGELQDEDMNYLYNHPKVKTMISFTKGEGFGRPLLEFSLIKKPIIVSGWSGHMDFLSSEFTTFVFGELRNIHESAANDMLLKESQWFNIVESSAVDTMKDIYKNYDKQIPKAKQQAHKNKQNFSIEKMQERLDEIFEKYIPKKVELKLPKFDKIELPK